MGMFRILKKYKEYVLPFPFLAIGSISFILGSMSVGILSLLLAFIIFADNKAKKILDAQTSYVYGDNWIRNVDILIIGDLFDACCLIPQDKKIVQISTPDSSIESVTWILKRMFSLVDEINGKIIIVLKERNLYKKGISLFEFSFLSPIYIKILNVQALAQKRNHPFIYAPLRTMKLLINRKKSRSVVWKYPPSKELVEFCEERNLNLEFRIIK